MDPTCSWNRRFTLSSIRSRLAVDKNRQAVASEQGSKGKSYRDEASTVAKPELGTKRVCPETGRKFYDLARDPIVSPYTGKAYPLTYFDDTAGVKIVEEAKEEEEVVETESEASGVEIVSLEEAESEETDGDDIPDIEDDSDVELEDDDADTFLEEDEDDDDDVSDIIGGVGDEEEET